MSLPDPELNINFYKPDRNPVLQTADLTKPMLTSQNPSSLPRHISPSTQSQPRAAQKAVPEESLNPYSVQDNLTLCPTLNFYQSYSQLQSQTAEQHLQNIRQNLERRIQSAQEAGNENLVTLLELEYQSLAL